MTDSLSYKNSGVDIDAQEDALKEIKRLVKTTFTKGVVSDIGLFGGLFSLGENDGRILVASADGVGTKIKVALEMKVFDTVGMDLVNHCVNDILAQGAEPLFFLDYYAAGRLIPERLVEVVKGLSRACAENGCALIGGETAEMPGVYHSDDFDLAGFIVGMVEKKNLLPRDVRENDLLVALPSTGLHTNGYSLARKLFFEKLGLKPVDFVDDLGGRAGELLLKVHRSYLPAVRGLIPNRGLHGIAHITGGGITDNLPRVLPEGLRAFVRKDSWEVPPLFAFILKNGNVAEDEMFRVFNMGVGLILIVDRKDIDPIMDHLKSLKEDPFIIGELRQGEKGVEYL
jgi:phosphoribosylformylglycinamidine cyclo-ligase